MHISTVTGLVNFTKSVFSRCGAIVIHILHPDVVRAAEKIPLALVYPPPPRRSLISWQ